ALDHALAHDLHASATRALNNLAVVFESNDRYREALETSDRMLEVARRVGNRGWEVQSLGGPVSALVLLGRWDEALARAAEAAALPGGVHAEGLELHLVEVDCWRGKPAEARARLEAAHEAGAAADPQALSSYALHEAMTLRSEGNPRGAL